MIARIASILKSKLESSLYVEKVAGLVTTGQRNQPTDIEGSFVVTKFPISVDTDYEECISNSCYKDLVPNSKLRGIMYFEDWGTNSAGRKGASYVYQSKLRVVVWLNNDLIQPVGCDSLAHLFINDIRTKLEIGPFNDTDIKQISVKSGLILNNDPAIFGRYTYPIEHVRFLMYPYEAFSIDLSVQYASTACLDNIVIVPKECES